MLIQFRSTRFKQYCFSTLILGAAFLGGCGAASDSPSEAEGGASSSAGASGVTSHAGATNVGGGGAFGGAVGSNGGQTSGGSAQAGSAGSQAAGSGGNAAGGAAGGASGGATSGGAGAGGSAAGAHSAGSGSGGTMGGSAGQGSGGKGGSGGGTAPTWTQLYTNFFNNAQYASNCAGSQCHNPGKQKNIDFSTQAKGYASAKASLNKLTSVLSNGSMPQGRPKMPAADLALYNQWVAAGALNN